MPKPLVVHRYEPLDGSVHVVQDNEMRYDEMRERRLRALEQSRINLEARKKKE
eukprot:CAMPEP_0170557662 /NCGR_PEP_ID=MMETSP0211-20121228/28972_1 /TAXON_ID=311385 /ORGANISM="Pseudokeronopsis sp., Strain OXSARD2" /LENGTH=52 /DNA_ID=CAMNT_0010868877 /DNA_START=310 /DNA_END=465 /DNA_ORIENTATION=-